MIGYIQGNIKEIQENNVLIVTASGVGYEAYINTPSYSHLVGETYAELYIYHHITENAQTLFGFMSLQEKNVFSELIKISGIGGKVAQNILSLGTEKLATALAFEDSKTIESIKGIGKKMAEKIILELKDKDLILQHQSSDGTRKDTSHLSAFVESQIVDTLTTMGYNKEQILVALKNVPEGVQEMDEVLPFVIKNI